MKNVLETLKKKWDENLYFAFNTNDEKSIKKFVDTYNTYQENEKGFADYIFNMNDKDDVISCLKGGLSIQSLCHTYQEMETNNKTPYYLFGGDCLPSLLDNGTLLSQLISYGDEIIENMILYPHSYDKEIYYEIITENFLNFS